MERTYFVYLHRRLDNGDVFYVGKGTRVSFGRQVQSQAYRRAFTTNKRNAFWNAVVRKSAYSVELIAEFFREEDALAFEVALIASYARRRAGGTLCNLTDGGEGVSGLVFSLDSREKMRLATAGNRHPNWGKKLSAETCRRKSESLRNSEHSLLGKKLPDWWKARISSAVRGPANVMYGRTGSAHPASRKVLDVQSGTVYDSVLLAAEATGHKMKTLCNYLSGHRANPTSLEFFTLK